MGGPFAPQLPCFGYGKPLEALRSRFRLDLSNAQAAEYMKGLILGAYDRFTTGEGGWWWWGGGGRPTAGGPTAREAGCPTAVPGLKGGHRRRAESSAHWLCCCRSLLLQVPTITSSTCSRASPSELDGENGERARSSVSCQLPEPFLHLLVPPDFEAPLPQVCPALPRLSPIGHVHANAMLLQACTCCCTAPARSSNKKHSHASIFITAFVLAARH